MPVRLVRHHCQSLLFPTQKSSHKQYRKQISTYRISNDGFCASPRLHFTIDTSKQSSENVEPRGWTYKTQSLPSSVHSPSSYHEYLPVASFPSRSNEHRTFFATLSKSSTESAVFRTCEPLGGSAFIRTRSLYFFPLSSASNGFNEHESPLSFFSPLTLTADEI